MTQSAPPVPPKPMVARIIRPRIRDWLATVRAHRVIVMLSVLFCAPSLATGLVLDDRVHQLVVNGTAGGIHGDRHPLNLFSFFDGNGETYREGVELGYVPWFAEPDLKLAFMRPLSALTHWFDYAVLGDAAWLMHVHSLVWLLLFGFAATRLIRSIEHGWVAGLTIALYLLDTSHGVPAGWLSNRNQLVVGLFGALSLTAHIQWCKAGRPSVPWPVWLFATLGFLSAEAMVGWLGFFVAYAVTLDPAGTKRGLRSLVPIALIVVAWRATYSALGYGTANSGMYIDPLASPVRFLGATAERLPQLLAGQLGGPPTGVGAIIGPEVERAFIGVSIGIVAILVAVFWRELKTDALTRFWALSALLAAIPFCATTPDARLMFIGGLGTAGFAARIIAKVIDGPTGPGQRPLAAWYHRWPAAIWLFTIVLFSPLLLPAKSQSMAQFGEPSYLAATRITIDDPEQTLVIVAVPEPLFMCGQFTLVRSSLDQPVPRRQRCLAPLEGSGKLTRVDDRTFDVRVDAGLFNAFFVSVIRPPNRPLPADWSLELSDLTLTIRERDASGEPQTLRVQLHQSPAEGHYRFVIWSVEQHRLVDLQLPEVGASIDLQGEPVLNLLK